MDSSFPLLIFLCFAFPYRFIAPQTLSVFIFVSYTHCKHLSEAPVLKNSQSLFSIIVWMFVLSLSSKRQGALGWAGNPPPMSSSLSSPGSNLLVPLSELGWNTQCWVSVYEFFPSSSFQEVVLAPAQTPRAQGGLTLEPPLLCLDLCQPGNAAGCGVSPNASYGTLKRAYPNIEGGWPLPYSNSHSHAYPPPEVGLLVFWGKCFWRVHMELTYEFEGSPSQTASRPRRPCGGKPHLPSVCLWQLSLTAR